MIELKPDQNSFMEDNRGERFDSWTSYSDMFCSLLMAFMLLFFYAMIQYSISSVNDASQISALQTEHAQQTAQLQQSLEQLREQLEETELELNIAQADLIAGLVRIDELENSLEASRLSLTERDELILQRDEEISALQSELEKAVQAGETLRTELSACWSELAAGEEALEEVENSHAAQIGALEAEVDALTGQNSALLTETEELTERCTALESSLSDVTARNARLQTGSEELIKRSKALENRIAELEAQPTDPDHEMLLLQQELSSAQAALAAQQRQTEEMDALYCAALEKEQSASAALAAAQDALSTLQSQNADLHAANASLEEEAAGLRGAAASLESEVAQMQTLISTQGAEMEAQQIMLEDLAGIRTEIIAKISDTLRSNGVSAYVDAKTGAITLDSQLLFGVNKAELSPEGKAFLRNFFPVYFEALMSPESRDYIAQIVVEGHTDTTGGYLSNLDLSLRRAQAVAEYCVSLFEDAQQQQLIRLICACGCSYSNPVLSEDGEVDMDRSRRVEIKFSMKDQYMVDKIRDIIEE